MLPDIVADLNKKGEQSDLNKALLDKAKSLVKQSRSVMARNYAKWDYQNSIFRGEIPPDNEDRKNQRQGKPTKMIVPNTYAQIMTFTSFLFLMFNQNRTFFELNPSGDEDYGTKNADCEKILERDLRHNQWNSVLFQHLLDIARFGPGILECSWTRKVVNLEVPSVPILTNLGGVETTLESGGGYQEFVKFEGNQIRPVSPYRFFPDTNFPLTDFLKGDFCAVEEEYTVGQLKDLERAGEVAGIDLIDPLPQNWTQSEQRGAETRSLITSTFVRDGKFDHNNKSHPVLVTKLQWKIIPSKFKYGSPEKRLGEIDSPVLYHVWYANDNRIIRAEPAGWWHNEFGFTSAQFLPDMHQTLNDGLADLIYRLQDVISWFVNSHISSVRRVMQNRLLVDPRAIDTASLDGEKDIYLRKGVSIPLDRALMQLKVQDVTGGHMADVDTLSKLMELVTGVNGNAMGQYNGGRRSAQEARVVTAGAAGRMKMHGHLIWDSSLGRLGKMMLSNTRQQLSFDSFRWAVGSKADEARYQIFKGTPDEVICGDDFFVFDSTLASEKGFMAQSLSELFQTILSIPGGPQAFDIDPKAVLDEMQRLRGGPPASTFSFQNRPVGSPMPPPVPLEQPNAQPGVV